MRARHTCDIPDFKRHVAFSDWVGFMLDAIVPNNELLPFLRLNATVGTTSSLHWPDVSTLTSEVLPEAYNQRPDLGKHGLLNRVTHLKSYD